MRACVYIIRTGYAQMLGRSGCGYCSSRRQGGGGRKSCRIHSEASSIKPQPILISTISIGRRRRERNGWALRLLESQHSLTAEPVAELERRDQNADPPDHTREDRTRFMGGKVTMVAKHVCCAKRRGENKINARNTTLVMAPF